MRRLGIICAVLMLAVAPTALGASASPTTKVYGGQAAPTQGTLDATGSSTKPDSASTGTLPFTGVDLGLVLVAGIGLVVMGYSLRRIARGADK